MTVRRPRLAGFTAPAVVALITAACGGGEKPAAGPAAAATKIAIAPTGDARADARTYLAKLCAKPVGGELNFMVWEGYTDTLFTKPFEEACGVKVNATYMGSSDDLVAKLRAGGAETIDLISPSSDAATAIIDAGLASPLDLARIPSYTDLSEGFRGPQGRPEGHRRIRRALGIRAQPADLRQTKIKPAPDSWGALWDKKYRGKLSLQDDIATLYMVAQYLGMDDPKDPAKLYNLSDEDLAKVKAKMLELRPNVRKYWVTAGDMTQLFQSGEIVAGEGWPLMTNQLRQAKYPAGRDDSEGRHHRLGRSLGAHQRRQEPGRGLRLARVHGAALHPEAPVRRHRLYRRQSGRQELHVRRTGREPAGHQRLRHQGELLAVEPAPREVPGDLERGEGAGKG